MLNEIKFEEHQTLEQVKENFQDAYIENDIVFWKTNDEMPFSEMTTNFVLAGFITKEHSTREVHTPESWSFCCCDNFFLMNTSLHLSHSMHCTMVSALQTC